MTEEWRPVAGYEGIYEVSNYGRIRSWWGWRGRKKADKPRILATPSDGVYPKVTLCDAAGVRTRARMHVLVAETFIGPRPDGLVLRHLDGDPMNNRVNNLAWGTQAENVHDKFRHGTDHQLAKTHCPQGHPYSGENLYLARGGKNRLCRTCSNAASLRRYHERARERRSSA